MTENKKQDMQNMVKLRRELAGTCDEVLGVMEELEQGVIPVDLKREREALGNSLNVLIQNICPIALHAHFQVGKSTTMSAMADGHEIAPCGRGDGGLRTSTLPIEMHHSGEGGVFIERYSEEELAEQVVTAVRARLKDGQRRYDLKADYDLLMNAVKEEIDAYRAADSGAVPDHLRRAILILAFYDSEAYQDLCAGKYNSVEAIQPFLAYSRHNVSNWKGLKEKGFDVIDEVDESGRPLFGEEESLHVFIRRIRIAMDSEFMKENGIALIDAPGTMVSAEDTERALKAAREAAVVLYMFKGDSQLSQSDVEMLRVLREAGVAEKVLFVINFWQNPLIIQQPGGIGEAILSALEQNGYTMEHHRRLLYYNAFLAARAAQGRLMLCGKLDALTEKAILEDAEKRRIRDVHNIKDAWVKTTQKVLSKVDADDTAVALGKKGLCPEMVEAVEAASGWRELIDALRSHVQKNRAAGMLLDFGAEPAKKAIAAMDQLLESCESEALRSQKEAEAEYSAANALLQDFAQRAGELIDRDFAHKGGGYHAMDKALAEDYFENVILASALPMSGRAAWKVYDAYSMSNQLRVMADKGVDALKAAVNAVGGLFGRDDLVHRDEVMTVKKTCMRIVEDSMHTEAAALDCKWMEKLNENEIYNSYVTRRVQDTQQRIADLWEKMGLDEHALLNQVKPELTLTGDFARDVKVHSQMMMQLQSERDIRFNISPEDLAVLGVGGVVIALSMIPGFGFVATLVSMALLLVLYLFVDDAREKAILKVQTELYSKARNGFYERKQAIMDSLIQGNASAPGLHAIRDFYGSALYAMVENQKVELERGYNQAHKIGEKSEEERREMAVYAKRFREEKLAPVREKLENIVAQIRTCGDR